MYKIHVCPRARSLFIVFEAHTTSQRLAAESGENPYPIPVRCHITGTIHADGRRFRITYFPLTWGKLRPPLKICERFGEASRCALKLRLCASDGNDPTKGQARLCARPDRMLRASNYVIRYASVPARSTPALSSFRRLICRSVTVSGASKYYMSIPCIFL